MDPKSTQNAPDLLLERCRKRESKAYREIYDLYSQAMFSISMRIVNSRDEAEDILQESFLKAFKDMSRFPTRAAFGSWLKKVVVNHSLDVVRKKKQNFISLDDTDVAESEEVEEDIPYTAAAITECIRLLPEGYRVILTLFLIEDYSHKEIAEMLTISEGTSKSQYNRAKKKLAELVKQKTLIYEHT